MSERIPVPSSLFTALPCVLTEEAVQVLAENRNVRIERIVSCGQCSPPNFWYDQEQDEWVALLRGAAEIRFADREDPVRLNPGDHLLIPARVKHRVESTSPAEPTIWLAVFFSPET